MRRGSNDCLKRGLTYWSSIEVVAIAPRAWPRSKLPYKDRPMHVGQARVQKLGIDGFKKLGSIVPFGDKKVRSGFVRQHQSGASAGARRPSCAHVLRTMLRNRRSAGSASKREWRARDMRRGLALSVALAPRSTADAPAAQRSVPDTAPEGQPINWLLMRCPPIIHLNDRLKKRYRLVETFEILGTNRFSRHER